MRSLSSRMKENYKMQLRCGFFHETGSARARRSLKIHTSHSSEKSWGGRLVERQRPEGLPVQPPCRLVILEGEANVRVELPFWPCPSNITISPQEDRLRWSVILEGEASTGVELLFWPCPSNNTISPQEDRGWMSGENILRSPACCPPLSG